MIQVEPNKIYTNSNMAIKVKLPSYETRRVEGTFLDEEGTKQDGKTLITYKGNTSQEGTPTPDNPIPVNVVTGYNKVVVSNKNLFDGEWQGGYLTSSGNIYSNYTRGMTFLNYIKVKPSTDYTISFDISSISLINTTHIAFYDKDKGFISRTALGNTATTNIEKHFTTSAATDYVLFSIYTGTNNTISPTNVTNFQLETGDEATTYTQHQGQEYEVNLGTIELCKIGTYQDKIYRQNGTWYLHKEVEKVNVSNLDTSALTRYSYNTNRAVFWITATNMETHSSQTDVFNAISNRFISATQQATWVVGNISYRYQDNDRLYIIVGPSLNTTELLKQWLTTNNTNIYYVLETPTDTEITNQALISQLEQIWENLKTYEGETIISQVNSDLPFYLDVLMEI